MNRLDINSLVKNAINGDKEAFVHLCQAKGKDVLFICTTRMRSLQDGEDAAQEVFAKMMSTITQLKNPEVFNVWMNRVILSVCNDMKRRSKKTTTDVPIDETLQEVLPEDRLDFLPAEYAEEHDKKQQILDVINTLSVRHRDVIVMFYYENLTQAEIGEIMGVSENSVEHMLRRARSNIKTRLEKQAGAAFYATAATGVPLSTVLSASMQGEAARLATGPVLQNILQAAGVLAAGLQPVVATATVSSIGTLGISLVTVAATAILGIAAVVYSGNQPQGTSSPMPVSAPVLSLSVPQQKEAEALAPEEGMGEENMPTSEANLWVEPPDAESTTPPPTTTPEALPVQPQQPGVETTRLTGQLVFVDAQGAPVAGAESYGAGYEIALIDPDGQCVATTQTDKTGGFALENIPLTGAGAHTLEVRPPYMAKGGFTDKNPGGVLAVEIARDMAQIEIFITDSLPPSGHITLQGQGLGGRINPTEAALLVSDETNTTVGWQIVPRAGGAALAQGSGAQVSEADFAAFMQTAPEGEYRLVFTVTDAAGNTAQVARMFLVRG